MFPVFISHKNYNQIGMCSSSISSSRVAVFRVSAAIVFYRLMQWEALQVKSLHSLGNIAIMLSSL